MLSIFQTEKEQLTNGEIDKVVDVGAYIAKDVMGRKFEVRSDMSLLVGDKILFRDGWIWSRAGKAVTPKVYEV